MEIAYPGFGRIVIDGTEFDHDVILDEGRVRARGQGTMATSRSPSLSKSAAALPRARSSPTDFRPAALLTSRKIVGLPAIQAFAFGFCRPMLGHSPKVAGTKGKRPAPLQSAAFLTRAPMFSSVVSSSEVSVQATGCMWAPASTVGFFTSPKPKAMKSLSILI